MLQARKRPTAALAAALLVCGQLALLLHFLLIPHHICPEHGVLEHGVAPHSSQAGAIRSAAASVVAIASAALDSGDDHDGCAIPARLERQPIGAGGGQCAAVSSTARACVSAFEHTQVIGTGRAILPAAPKQSPPASTRS
ncbi:MAG TPA: hypothetical protein VL137_13370 [Polyangiaceae bacterium]|nr:hypothetical protein [Polyangiaceae bacterium]